MTSRDSPVVGLIARGMLRKYYSQSPGILGTQAPEESPKKSHANKIARIGIPNQTNIKSGIKKTASRSIIARNTNATTFVVRFSESINWLANGRPNPTARNKVKSIKKPIDASLFHFNF